MSSGFALHRTTASGTKRTAQHLETEEIHDVSRAASLTVTANTDDVAAPSHTSHIDELSDSTNTSALDLATAKIEAFVRTLHYPQQRAVFQDNTLRYLHTFADFYRESKILLKTKDDPTYCPLSCRISIPMQPTKRVRESTAFKALADESARISHELSLKMAAQVLKCKCLINADKQRESVEIFAKGLANMAEILLAEVNTPSTTKHDLVADLLSNHEVDAIGHINMSLDRFVDIYKEVNKLPNRLQLTQHNQETNPHHPDDQNSHRLHATMTTGHPLAAPPENTTVPMLAQPLIPPTLPNPYTTNKTAPSVGAVTQTSTTKTPPPNFVTALSLLPPPERTPLLNMTETLPPTPPLPTPPQYTPLQTTTTTTATFNTNDSTIAAFEAAFAYGLTPPTPTQPAPQTAETTATHNPPPLYTTLNPYSRGNTIIHYSREYTTQELEAIQMAEQSHQNALTATRTATLNSLRSSGRAMTSNMLRDSPTHTNDSVNTPAATPVTDVIHTRARDDADSSTLTGTGDGTTPSSRSSVTFHHTLTSGTHHGALNTLCTAVLKCFAASQAAYIRAFNAKAIEATLSKIAARQRTEECAESMAITINSESTPTPRTVGATIDARICRSQQELEKRLQSLEQRLANEKNKSASFERRLQQQQTHYTNPPTQSARQPAKDSGACPWAPQQRNPQ
jgi:hypothetical protein